MDYELHEGMGQLSFCSLFVVGCIVLCAQSLLSRASECGLVLGNSVFADIFKVKLKRRSYWIREGPKSKESIFIKDRKGHRDSKCVNLKAEIRIMHAEAKEHQGLSVNYRKLGARDGTDSQSLQKERPCLHLDFWISGLQNWERLDFCCVKCVQCVTICYIIPRKQI